MNNISYDEFMKTDSYDNFIKNNPSLGYLSIRANAANLALPISDLKIVVSKIIDNNNIIFYEGKTDDSGMIKKISLPAPKKVDNLLIPLSTTYNIDVLYNNKKLNYNVKIYDGICIIQNINIVPEMSEYSGN